jgi:hypothetical protein
VAFDQRALIAPQRAFLGDDGDDLDLASGLTMSFDDSGSSGGVPGLIDSGASSSSPAPASSDAYAGETPLPANWQNQAVLSFDSAGNPVTSGSSSSSGDASAGLAAVVAALKAAGTIGSTVLTSQAARQGLARAGVNMIPTSAVPAPAVASSGPLGLSTSSWLVILAPLAVAAFFSGGSRAPARVEAKAAA